MKRSLKAFQRRNTKKTNEGILLATSATIYLPICSFIYFFFFFNIFNLILWIWEQGTVNARQVLLAIFLALMSCFLIQNRTHVLILMAVGIQPKREEYG